MAILKKKKEAEKKKKEAKAALREVITPAPSPAVVTAKPSPVVSASQAPATATNASAPVTLDAPPAAPAQRPPQVYVAGSLPVPPGKTVVVASGERRGVAGYDESGAATGASNALGGTILVSTRVGTEPGQSIADFLSTGTGEFAPENNADIAAQLAAARGEEAAGSMSKREKRKERRQERRERIKSGLKKVGKGIKNGLGKLVDLGKDALAAYGGGNAGDAAPTTAPSVDPVLLGVGALGVLAVGYLLLGDDA